MGKHLARAAARRKAQRRRDIIRLASAAGTVVVAVSALALTANGAVATAKAAPAASTVLDGAGTDAKAGVAAAAIAAPSYATLAYTHTSVHTVPKPKPKKMAVASATPARPEEGTLLAPLDVVQPTSPFGLRTSPITGVRGEFHWGEDFAAACGAGVHAADAGVVRAAGWAQGGGGNRIEVDHGNGLVTTYNHLATIGVREGQKVQPGELIATAGTTGSSTGCHLHFETIRNGTYTDPAAWQLLPLRRAAAGVR